MISDAPCWWDGRRRSAATAGVCSYQAKMSPAAGSPPLPSGHTQPAGTTPRIMCGASYRRGEEAIIIHVCINSARHHGNGRISSGAVLEEWRSIAPRWRKWIHVHFLCGFLKKEYFIWCHILNVIPEHNKWATSVCGASCERCQTRGKRSFRWENI